jgi:hypothetical protein
MIGNFHFYRYMSLPADRDFPDFEAAVWAYARTWQAKADAVPEPIRPAVAEAAERLSAIATMNNMALAVLNDSDPDVAGLTQAVLGFQTAADVAPAGSPERSMSQSNLALALRARFVLTFASEDLDQAIAALREAVGVAHARRAEALSNLGEMLKARFALTGQPVDLDQAIRVVHEAVAATPTGHPSRAAMLSNLGGALAIRSYLPTGQAADLGEAIRVLHEAVAATTGGDTGRPGYLSDLGGALYIQYEKTRNAADLEQAIAVAHQAVNDASIGHLDRPRFLQNLGIALQTRSNLPGRPGNAARADLDEAIALLQEAVASRHPERAKMLANLADMQRERARRFP